MGYFYSLNVGIAQPAAGSVTEALLNRTLSSLLLDILRAKATSASAQSKFTIFGKSGQEEALDKEELRRKVQEAVAAQKAKKKKNKKEDETDRRFNSLKDAKKGGNGSSGRGFGI